MIGKRALATLMAGEDRRLAKMVSEQWAAPQRDQWLSRQCPYGNVCALAACVDEGGKCDLDRMREEQEKAK